MNQQIGIRVNHPVSQRRRHRIVRGAPLRSMTVSTTASAKEHLTATLAFSIVGSLRRCGQRAEIKHYRLQECGRKLRMSGSTLGPALHLDRRAIFLGEPLRSYAEIGVVGGYDLLQQMRLIGFAPKASERHALIGHIPHAISMAVQPTFALSSLVHED